MGTAEWSHCFVFMVLLSTRVVDAVRMHWENLPAGALQSSRGPWNEGDVMAAPARI